MATALSSIARLKPEIKLAQALFNFESDLSKSEQRAFAIYARSSPPDASDVMRLITEIDARASEAVNRRCFGPRITSFLSTLQQFAALGDVVVGGSQNLAAAAIWGAVRMSLLVRLAVPISQYTP